MSRRFKPWVVATLTALIATSLSMLGSVSSASAAPGEPIIPMTPSCVVELVTGDPATAPPAPTCYDPSGSDLDEFLVPVYVDSFGWGVSYVDPSMNPYAKDRPNSTRGASQVSVQAMWYDPSMGGYGYSGHAWRLTFNTSVTAAPSPNSYSVSVGGCVGNNLRQVTASFRNEAGPDGRYVGHVYPQAYANGVNVLDTQPAQRVYDGSTVDIPLVYVAEDGNGILGGYTYTVDFYLTDTNSVAGSGSGTRRLGGSVKVNVPSCKPGSTPGTGDSVKPRAKIVVLKRGKVFNVVKVMMGSREATQKTRYKVIRDPRKGRTLRKAYVTKHKVVTFYKVRKGTVVKVRYKSTSLRRVV